MSSKFTYVFQDISPTYFTKKNILIIQNFQNFSIKDFIIKFYGITSAEKNDVIVLLCNFTIIYSYLQT